MAKTFFHRLTSQPLVFVISSGVLMPTGLRHCLRTAAGQPCHVVIQPAWYVKRQADHIERAIEETRQANPGVTFSVICPTAEETDLLCSMGIHALHIHKNAFLDDRIFRPIAGVVKDRSANGTSASVGLAGRIMRSNRRSWLGRMRADR